MHDELSEEIAGGNGCDRQRGAKEENWDNCNSIINNIYLKKLKKLSPCPHVAKQR